MECQHAAAIKSRISAVIMVPDQTYVLCSSWSDCAQSSERMPRCVRVKGIHSWNEYCCWHIGYWMSVLWSLMEDVCYMEGGTPGATVSYNVQKYHFAFCPQDELLFIWKVDALCSGQEAGRDLKCSWIKNGTEIEMWTDCALISGLFVQNKNSSLARIIMHQAKNKTCCVSVSPPQISLSVREVATTGKLNLMIPIAVQHNDCCSEWK